MASKLAYPHAAHAMASSSRQPNKVSGTRKARKRVAATFPEKLHRMLHDAENIGFDDIVSWEPHGRAFVVHDKHRFGLEIMPMYFKQSVFASFRRQLSHYGYKKLKKGKDEGAYYHPTMSFLRGLPGLSANIQRVPSASTSQAQNDPELEPDFYDMPPLPDKSSKAASKPDMPIPKKSQRPHDNVNAKLLRPMITNLNIAPLSCDLQLIPSNVSSGEDTIEGKDIRTMKISSILRAAESLCKINDAEEQSMAGVCLGIFQEVCTVGPPKSASLRLCITHEDTWQALGSFSVATEERHVRSSFSEKVDLFDSHFHTFGGKQQFTGDYLPSASEILEGVEF